MVVPRCPAKLVELIRERWTLSGQVDAFFAVSGAFNHADDSDSEHEHLVQLFRQSTSSDAKRNY